MSACAPAPTTALVTLQGSDSLQSLSIAVATGNGAIQRSYDALALPQTVLIELPDLAEAVSVTATAQTTDDRALAAAGSVVSVPHQQVPLTLQLGALADGGAGVDGDGSDGGVIVDWHQLATSGPTARHSLKMVYDSFRQQLVLFSGEDQTGDVGGTYVWNGSAWTQVMVSGPGARRGYAMTYDSDRHVAVLFGGVTNAGEQNDVWEWNGAAWSNVTPSSGSMPAVMHAPAIAYHAARQRTVEFGGWSGALNTNPPDTWEWDGTSWTHQAPANHPPPDNAHELIYDEDRQTVVFVSGRSGEGANVSLWEYDVSGAWTQVTSPSGAPAPSGRRTPAVAYDPTRKVVLLFGGMDATSHDDLADTWQWDGTGWLSLRVSGPSGRRSFASDFDRARGQWVIFGGGAGKQGNKNDTGPSKYLGDTWALY